jgi:hypothetical protein
MNEANETSPMRRRGRIKKDSQEGGWETTEGWSESNGAGNFSGAEIPPEIPVNARQNGVMGASRKKIEEYFEKKRLEEVLDEKLEDNIFER